jgi:hypothetical protein
MQLFIMAETLTPVLLLLLFLLAGLRATAARPARPGHFCVLVRRHVVLSC